MTTPAEFFLRTLGVPRLFTAAGAEVRIRVRKHLALLTVLAVEGGKIRRERLVEMLWPDSPAGHARGSLATGISFLRSRLGPGAIEPARDHVELMPGLVACDLDRLEAGQIIGDDFTPTLEIDGFLAGFELGGLPGFETWRDRQNARLLPAIEQGLMVLADYAKRSGNLNDLARHADRLLQLNDLSEPGIKARMEACALSGDRITALRVYDEWVTRLRAEIGAAPARALEELANRLRRRSWDQPTAGVTAPPVSTEQWRDQTFVGRAREYRRLYALWEEAKQGTARQVLITGDSGVGKTTLADRFATSVALEGAGVSRVRCFELERGIPYAMIGGALAGLLDRPGASATSPESLAELARILPSIRNRYPGLPPAGELTGDSARIRFAESALDFLRSILEESPVLLVIDDFDQSDEVSLGVIHFLQRRLADSPMMVAFTARTGEAERRAARTRASLIGDRAVAETVDVAPLTDDESAALFEALIAQGPRRPTPGERRALIAGSGGFPLALEMLVRDWQERGRDSVAFAVGSMATTVGGPEDSRYDRLTQALLADFDDTDRVALSMAAILDRRVGNLDLYQLADLPPARVLAVLSRMITRRALRDTGATIEWINPTVRMRVYLQMPPSLRRSIHSLIADELVRADHDKDLHGLEIAWHLSRAGRAAEGAPYLISGAEYAINHGAPDEAELALSSAMPTIPADLREEALLALAESHQAQGDWVESINCLSQLPMSSPTGEVARLLQLRAEGVLGRIDYAQTSAHIQALCELIRSAESLRCRLLAFSVGGNLVNLHVPRLLACSLLDAADSIDTTTLTPAGTLSYLSTKAKLLYYDRRLNESEEVLQQALVVANANGVRNAHYLSALIGLSAIAAARGRYLECLERSTVQLSEARRLRMPLLAGNAVNNICVSLIRLGRYDEIAVWIAKSESTQALMVFDKDIREYIIGLTCGFQGNRSTAISAAKTLIDDQATSSSPTRRRASLLCAADLFLLAGRPQQGLNVAAEALSISSLPWDDIGTAGRTARWTAMTAISQGTPQKADPLLRELLRLPLDAYDRVECLFALRAIGANEEWLEIEIRDRLTELPSPAATQVSRLCSLNLLAEDAPLPPDTPTTLPHWSGGSSSQEEAPV